MERLGKRFPVYSRLLWLYPAPYRAKYGPEMLQTLADMLDNAPTTRDRSLVRLQAAIDLPVSVIQQDIQYIGGIMANEMPRYVKQNALISALLLVPFMLALIANGFDKAISNQTLYNSWLWHSPLLGIWVLWLPLAATILSGATLLTFLVRRIKQGEGGVLQRALSIQYTWPLVGALLAGLFILAVLFGHDSTHCVLGNPITELRHPQQTWQCINQGASTYPFQHPVEFLKRAVLG